MIRLLITIYAGLEHAFEADHLLAVNNLVTNRSKIKDALKDGMFWGIGHTATIFIVGIIMIGFKISISEHVFSYLEAGVGLMLIVLGIIRLFKLLYKKKHSHTYYHSHVHTHSNGLTHTHMHAHTYEHSHPIATFKHSHYNESTNYKTAFGVGLIHGLAGSGSLVILVISQMKTPLQGLLYILIFGVGSIIGMFAASGLFSIPFTKSILKSQKLQYSLIIISSVICILYGVKIIYSNLFTA
ncbi:ABC-type nickel/cobalt efflux system permease component RcnA [Flavobacterium sp. 90]|uniref:HoxN/HupN/NixA family nickel/cobalt transporter n=1 Tax=unclassified Flavobacterium TaxID=196869 RepID=UPI000EAF7143|nr:MULTISPECIES: sulfite exporter TauE/SafE family protein [unclassified Flavobacterium]RKR11707.1 ABC-type nickel/cobalt efflux system permease component RcnA [Flavobacterium sp. 81]TCK55483.1 ABC-type nickel/cobalt efflux system permease component RcnA [Flavobacterium sp. 90]